MSIAFRAQVTSTQKLVLLALCDSANDAGECYPSVPTLMIKCSLSERAVQAAVGDLERLGQLHRELRIGRSTVYWMTPNADQPPQQVHPRTTRTPAAGAPTPARRAPPPPQQVHPTPAAGAPITINEPSIDPSGNHQKRAAPTKQAKPETVSVETLMAIGFDAAGAADFIAHKAARKAPLTARAWKDHLTESAKAGWTPMEAAEKVMAKNWSGFEARYVADKTAPQQPYGNAKAARDAKARQLLGMRQPQGDFIDG